MSLNLLYEQKKVKVPQSCPTLCNPMEFSRPEYWHGKLFTSPGIFPNQGLNSGLLHCRWILYQLSHKGSPRILEWVAYPLYPYPGIELVSPSLQADTLPTEYQFSHSVPSASLRTHGLQHAKPPCPSPTLGVYSNSCPLSW